MKGNHYSLGDGDLSERNWEDAFNPVSNQLGKRKTEGRDQKTKERVSIKFDTQKYRKQKALGRGNNQYRTARKIMLNYKDSKRNFK